MKTLGYPRGFNLRCLDGWTKGIDPRIEPPDFKSPLQGATWFETMSILHEKLKKYKTPYPWFHRFCHKTVLQISHSHLLFSHNIVWFWYTPILMNDLEHTKWKKSGKSWGLYISKFLAYLHISCYTLIGWTRTWSNRFSIKISLKNFYDNIPQKSHMKKL